MSIPRIIHQIHIGKPMDEQVRGWVSSFARFHPDWTHVVWDEEMLAAIGFIREDYIEWGPSAAGITNFLRLQLIEKFGGIWCDTDCECVAPLERLLQNDAFVAEQDREGGLPRYCNAIFGARAGHGWIRYQIEQAAQFSSNDPTWGVDLMSMATDGSRRIGDVTIIPKWWVYPFLWSDPPENKVAHPESLLVHHWQGSWAR